MPLNIYPIVIASCVFVLFLNISNISKGNGIHGLMSFFFTAVMSMLGILYIKNISYLVCFLIFCVMGSMGVFANHSKNKDGNKELTVFALNTSILAIGRFDLFILGVIFNVIYILYQHKSSLYNLNLFVLTLGLFGLSMSRIDTINGLISGIGKEDLLILSNIILICYMSTILFKIEHLNKENEQIILNLLGHFFRFMTVGLLLYPYTSKSEAFHQNMAYFLIVAILYSLFMILRSKNIRHYFYFSFNYMLLGCYVCFIAFGYEIYSISVIPILIGEGAYRFYGDRLDNKIMKWRSGGTSFGLHYYFLLLLFSGLPFSFSFWIKNRTYNYFEQTGHNFGAAFISVVSIFVIYKALIDITARPTKFEFKVLDKRNRWMFFILTSMFLVWVFLNIPGFMSTYFSNILYENLFAKQFAHVEKMNVILLLEAVVIAITPYIFIYNKKTVLLFKKVYSVMYPKYDVLATIYISTILMRFRIMSKSIRSLIKGIFWFPYEGIKLLITQVLILNIFLLDEGHIFLKNMSKVVFIKYIFAGSGFLTLIVYYLNR